MPIGERFCLSFSLLRLTENGVGPSHPQLGLWSRQQGQKQVARPSRWRPLRPCSAYSPLAGPVPRSLHARPPSGQLGRFMLVFCCSVRSKRSRPFAGHTAAATSPGEGSTRGGSQRGCSENSGVTLRGHSGVHGMGHREGLGWVT